MRAAINTAAGNRPSLQDSVEFGESLAALPGGVGDLTFYVAARVWDDIYEGIYSNPFGPSESQLAGFDPFDGYGSAAVSVSLVDDGIRVDGSMFYDYADGLTPDSTLIERIPSDALFYAVASDRSAADRYGRIFGDPALAAGLEDFSAETGLDLVADFLEPLSGSAAIYGRPGDTADPFELDLGVAAWIGLADPQRMDATIRKIEDLALGTGPAVVVSDGELNSIDLGDGAPPLRYGVTGEWLALAWNTDPIADAAGPSITETETYRALTSILGGEPVMFIDIAGLVDQFASVDDDVRGDLAPIRHLGVSMNGTDGLLTGSMILVVDWAE